MEKINEGDVVTLKSGSAEMTVIEIDGKYARCKWMDRERKIQLHRLTTTIPFISLQEIALFGAYKMERNQFAIIS